MALETQGGQGGPLRPGDLVFLSWEPGQFSLSRPVNNTSKQPLRGPSAAAPCAVGGG